MALCRWCLGLPRCVPCRTAHSLPREAATFLARLVQAWTSELLAEAQNRQQNSTWNASHQQGKQHTDRLRKKAALLDGMARYRLLMGLFEEWLGIA